MFESLLSGSLATNMLLLSSLFILILAAIAKQHYKKHDDDLNRIWLFLAAVNSPIFIVAYYAFFIENLWRLAGLACILLLTAVIDKYFLTNKNKKPLLL